MDNSRINILKAESGCKIHLSDALGCILSDVPGGIGGSRSFNIRPSCPGEPDGVDGLSLQLW